MTRAGLEESLRQVGCGLLAIGNITDDEPSPSSRETLPRANSKSSRRLLPGRQPGQLMNPA
ncbi:hypothetical protein [Streptomyces sp. NPDC056549]|uniref:hypothetical protein n=1 Tax=Streptomyces sp. NPDC056549 TaxID=3345864 RepID=UPI00368EBEB8